VGGTGQSEPAPALVRPALPVLRPLAPRPAYLAQRQAPSFPA
jgi:hypothetical protein